MRGIAYGIGVGPGDPELMSLKAVRLIRECAVIAVPGRTAEESAAYRIAAAAVPEIADKETVAVSMPMTRDRAALEAAHREAASLLESHLDRGEDVAYLSLGDPSVYCTFGYLMRILKEDGYDTGTVPGVTSFCAAASRLGITLAEGDEPLHVIPGSGIPEDIADRKGTFVIMKSGRGMSKVRDLLSGSGKNVTAVENCGMRGEKVYGSLEDIPDDAGYFTLIVAKDC